VPGRRRAGRHSRRRIAEKRDVTVGKRVVRVLDRFARCTDCGEELYAPGQMDATQRRASDLIPKQDGLFLPEEIRAIREALGLTQHAFERLPGRAARGSATRRYPRERRHPVGTTSARRLHLHRLAHPAILAPPGGRDGAPGLDGIPAPPRPHCGVVHCI